MLNSWRELLPLTFSEKGEQAGGKGYSCRQAPTHEKKGLGKESKFYAHRKPGGEGLGLLADGKGMIWTVTAGDNRGGKGIRTVHEHWVSDKKVFFLGV